MRQTHHNYEWSHCMLVVWQYDNWGDSWRVSIVYKDMAYAKQIQRIAESHCVHDGSPTAGYAWASARIPWDVAMRMIAEIEALIETTPDSKPAPEPSGQLSFI